MATWSITLDFGAGPQEIAAYVDIKTFRKSETKFSKDYKPVIDTCDFLMYRNETIINSILTSTTDIVVIITKDTGGGAVGYFHGFLRKNNFQVAIASKTLGVRIQCVSRSWLFKKKISGNSQYASYVVSDTGTPANSLVHVLAQAAGFTLGEIDVDDIVKTIDYLVILDNTITYEELLTKLLFDFGYVFDINGDGDLITYNFLQATTATANSLEASVSKQNVIKNFTINAKDRNFDGARIKHYSHFSIPNSIVFSEGDGGDSENKCNVVIPNLTYWPLNSNQVTTYAEYTLTDYDVITVTSPTVSKVVDGALTTGLEIDYFKKMNIQYLNNSGSERLMTKYDITGTAIVKGRINITERQEVVNGQKFFEYESEFITAQADATKLACGLALRYKYSDKEYVCSSKDEFLCGDFVDVIEDFSQNFDVRCVIQSIITTEYPTEYRYTCLPLEAYAVQTISTAADYLQPSPISPSQVGSLVEDLAAKPTYTEVQTGYTQGGGTKTPTQPVISVVKGLFKGVFLSWDRQLNLTNFDRYDVQVSSDDSTWYSLEFDLTDWKDTLDVDTEWPLEWLTHPVPHGGTAAVPTAQTLYYRVRRVTKEPVLSAWSTSATATTSVVDNGDLAANSLSVNKLIAAEINTMFLSATASIIVGYAGTGSNDSPNEGDRRTVIEDDEMRQEEWTAGAWSTVRGIIIGGVLAGLFLSMMGCSGVYHQENPPTSNELLPNNEFLIYNFENNYEDQYGVDDWDYSLNMAFSTVQKKFGNYSLFTSSITGTKRKYAYGTIGEDQSAGAWIYCTELNGSYIYVISYQDSPSNNIGILVNNTNVRFYVQKGGTNNNFDYAIDLTSAWNYVAFSYDSSTDILYAIVNNTITEYDSISGTWGSGTFDMTLVTHNNPGSYVKYTDEVLFNKNRFTNPDIFVQHYNHGVAWNTDFSAADVVLRCNTGGRVRFDTQQAEESVGTLHLIADSDRPSTWVLSNGSASTFTDVDFSNYVPTGVKALYLTALSSFQGDGSNDYSDMTIRKNGSTETDNDKLHYTINWFSLLANGTYTQYTKTIICECDNNGVIEYKTGGTNPGYYLNILGYYI